VKGQKILRSSQIVTQYWGMGESHEAARVRPQAADPLPMERFLASPAAQTCHRDLVPEREPTEL
jgi:hypothetical protein